MELSLGNAHALVVQVMRKFEQNTEYANIIADHIIDCELRGLSYGGLARILSITERLQRTGNPTNLVEVVLETPTSARLRGHDNLGYVVGYKATELAISKAKETGIAIVGANETWYTGMLSYFAEMAAAEGMISIIASNCTAWVAPHNAVDGRFGTNPICFGFPSQDVPIIWDIGTSSIMHAEVMLAERLGQELDEGVAFDETGLPTRDPKSALAGAFAPWGGHKGAGLGMVVQMLGILAGSPIQPPDLAEFGFLIIVTKSDLMMPEQKFREMISGYADFVRSARPMEGVVSNIRMPFQRSYKERELAKQKNTIEVADTVYQKLKKVIEI